MIDLFEPDQRMTWDEFGLALAEFVALGRSKDPSTKVGAYICNELHQSRSIGYNGFPRGVPDDTTLLAIREKRLLMTVHAEINAIANAAGRVRGCTMHVWPMPPCGPCMSIMAQFGIARVVAPEHYPERWQESVETGFYVAEKAGIEVVLLPSTRGLNHDQT